MLQLILFVDQNFVKKKKHVDEFGIMMLSEKT